MVSRAGTAANAARTPKSRQSRSHSRFRQYGQLYLLLLPAFIYVAIFCYGPMYGLQIAFKNYKMSLGIAGSPWIGMRNFKDFFGGYYFPTLMKNTFTLSLLALVFSCLLAWAPGLNRISAGIAIVLSTVAAAAICAAKFPVADEEAAQ